MSADSADPASNVSPAASSGGWETASEEGAEPGAVEQGALAGEAQQQATDPQSKVLNQGFGQHGCEHYRRRCKLVSPCCGEVVWCRHCHNLQRSDNEQDPKKRHVLDRKAVREVVCALCDTRQPAARACMACGTAFGAFACLLCNFFDDDVSKKQFHCDKCGICRVGGRENFFHCDTCNCCYAVQLRNTHVCIENSMHHNCPVCSEFLFDSVKPINVLPCGHTIHQECLRNLADHHTYVCPICSKTYMSQQSMERVWAEMDQVVATTPMPDEYKNVKVNILCNDCSARSSVTFHVVGHKCASCGGYNTRRL